MESNTAVGDSIVFRMAEEYIRVAAMFELTGWSAVSGAISFWCLGRHPQATDEREVVNLDRKRGRVKNVGHDERRDR